jgi:hypothetical protein
VGNTTDENNIAAAPAYRLHNNCAFDATAIENNKQSTLNGNLLLGLRDRSYDLALWMKS